MEFGYEAMKTHARQQEIDAVPRQRPSLAGADGAKFLHAGFPLGRILPAGRASGLAQSLYGGDGCVPLSTEERALGDGTCIVTYLKELSQELMERSCSKCVLCREGLRQLNLVFEEITRGRSHPERLTYAKEVAQAMAVGCDCDFGKGAGRLFELALEDFADEIDQHILKKRCPALVCRAYFTVHVLADRCVGCGKCMEVCPEDAILGKDGYIHMVDQDMCEQCGRCLAVCPQHARVKAGRVKPRGPERLIRVGTYGGRAQREPGGF